MDEQTRETMQRLISAIGELAEAVRENTVSLKHANSVNDQNGREIETLRVRISQHMEVTDSVGRMMSRLEGAFVKYPIHEDIIL
ncbi:MAG: hypothetical protein A2782_03490 [Candidatus Blackburnbacteria bacterium RIFCSPHIGHO2_01_FULL_43_15b]|uniref:Uncharacterized protein n=1 Tax=Candidatus Blackburnbacteria bacterium RIFCSPHIGHO2_01_FULL_43_15b TaxID=1797513 RepID=A0A1G1V2I2_9BACT|nr:MAG: hypothetical protein A2782_03490 [Candidatus Blackburnbacteria bacterium RIFCSPHIGHO2_01_FULL_43_15b]